MISFAFGLTLASYASAQVVSMMPNPNLSPSGSASASSPMSASSAAASSSSSGSSGNSMSSSPNQYNQYGSSASSAPPSYNQYTSAPAQYTPPPMSEAMPYASFMNGGYQSMSCGYGYVKGSDGSCTSQESWVRTSDHEVSRVM
jgi:hypothetical protein